eukprot:m.201268 g.201268  ORF g.201268 m.201268 type:complete len:617 (+) comp25959_c0_seq3:51-1901(+)
MDESNPLSLKEVACRIIYDDMLDQVKPSPTWKVLIVDSFTLQIIQSCCSQNELTAHDVAVVENIDRQRQPMQGLEAIYFLQPTKENVNTIISDCNFEDEMYQAAHLYFTAELSSDLLRELGQDPKTHKRLRSLKELNLSFVPLEQQVFTFGDTSGLRSCYCPEGVHQLEAEVKQIAHNMASVCAAFTELPLIHYQWDSTLGPQVAKELHSKLHSLGVKKPKHRKRSVVLILDRNHDIVAPLVHEISYQAFAYDQLNIQNDQFDFTIVNGKGKTVEKRGLLSDDDESWRRWRHWPIDEVLADIPAAVKAFSASQHTSEQQRKNKLEDLQEQMKNLPHRIEELSKFSLHLQMSKQCQQKLVHLIPCIEAEQNLLTGEKFKDGEVVEFDYPLEMCRPFGSKNIEPIDKLRTLLIGAVVMQGLPPQELEGLLEDGHLAEDYSGLLSKFQQLGINLTSTKAHKPLKFDAAEGSLDYARWVPNVQGLMRDVLEGNLDRKDFPSLNNERDYHNPPKNSEHQYVVEDEDDAIVSRRRKRHRGGWAKKGKPSAGPRADSLKAKDLAERPKLFVLVLGAVSYGEMRTAYQVSQENSEWDVYIGSHASMSPNAFIEAIDSFTKLTSV